jgi:hypothetical protein
MLDSRLDSSSRDLSDNGSNPTIDDSKYKYKCNNPNHYCRSKH